MNQALRPIYVGNGQVVHYAGFCGAFRRGPVQQISLEEFAGGFGYRVKRTTRRQFAEQEVAQRALSRVGENCYHLLYNNCEHFCEWCVSGKSWSAQAEAWLSFPFTTVLGLLRALRQRPAAI